ncbi:MAG: hypothetical protein CM15mP86_10790 [Gammaproteobacteria bacterium]|nr:MAG: hypothetical protein CM15mP86_10790 [Gammaproteobacteria bacterium]
MRIFLVICAFSISSCSMDYNLDSQSISIKYSKEGISHPSILEGKILSHLQKTDFTMEEELFLNSWISFFRTTSNLGNEVLVEVMEHKPVASLDNNRYLTQGGWIIEPEKENKTLNLIQLIGKDRKVNHLLDVASSIQTTLNFGSNYIVKIEDKGTNFLEATDNSGRKYRFTEENFRVQLERLEDFLLFELNSGIGDDIKYIDLRYKNALAVGYKNTEKTI